MGGGGTVESFSLRQGLTKLAEAFGVGRDRLNKLVDVYAGVLGKRLSERQFELAVENLLVNSERFPTIKAFLEVARTFPDPKAAREMQACATCGGTGIVAARKDGYRAVFACQDCGNCRFNYPGWSDGRYEEGWAREVDGGWDPSDQAQVKGLVLLGRDSLAWKKAPQEMQAAAQAMIAGGWRPQEGTLGGALTSRPDPQKESDRARALAEDRRRSGDDEDFETAKRRMIEDYNRGARDRKTAAAGDDDDSPF